jgi:hypothetical protein
LLGHFSRQHGKNWDSWKFLRLFQKIYGIFGLMRMLKEYIWIAGFFRILWFLEFLGFCCCGKNLLGHPGGMEKIEIFDNF